MNSSISTMITGNSEILIKTEQRLTQIDEAKSIVLSESERSSEVEKLRTERRIRAETKARQRNLGVEETEAIGIAAAAEIDDPGPMNKEEFEQALSTLDDNEVEQSRGSSKSHLTDGRMPFRPESAHEWEAEKSRRREMKQYTHALYPIGNNGGQRLLDQIGKGALSVDVSIRRCTKCGRDTHEIRCRHDYGDGSPLAMEERKSEGKKIQIEDSGEKKYQFTALLRPLEKPQSELITPTNQSNKTT